MKSYLQKVKTKLHLQTPLKAAHLLDGAYEAVVKGVSMDFEELRSYSPGDRRKDIDWKSSARANNLLVKQYVAQKRIPVELVVDTGLNMYGLAPSGETKLELALETAGIFSYLALNHNDAVGVVYGDSTKTNQTKQTSSSKHIEGYLTEIASAGVKQQSNSDVTKQLAHVVNKPGGRRIVIIISGLVSPTIEVSDIIRKLKTKHDVFWITVDDINPFLPANNIVDIETKKKLPYFLKKNKKLENSFLESEQKRKTDLTHFFDKELVANTTITSSETLIDSIINLLLTRKHGKH